MEIKVAISSIILIVFIVFPGIIIRRSYFSGQFTKQFYEGSFSDRIITTVFWGILSQIITILVYNHSIKEGLNIQTIWDFLFSKESNNINTGESTNLFNDKNLINFLIFIFLSLLIPWLLGFLAHQFIRIFNFDLRLNTLRFNNYWHYYLSGEIVKTKEFNNSENPSLFSNGIKETYIDILVDVGEENKLYSGKFFQYSIQKESNQLDNIFITDVKRYSRKRKEYVNVPGDFMQIPFARILNMNIRYFEKETTKKQRILQLIILLIAIIGIVCILILPWIFLKDIGLFNKIIGIVFSILSLLFLLVSIQVKFSSAIKNKNQVFTIAILFFVAFTLISLFSFDIF